MAYTISKIVSQFKADVGKALSAETIVKICGYLGHAWRERVLDPVTTVHVFPCKFFMATPHARRCRA